VRRYELPVELDATGLMPAAGPGGYQHGVEYARRNAVVQASWDQANGALSGTVHGRLGDFYTTTAWFAADGHTYRFREGECSCPVGLDCKHVVALVLSVAGTSQRAPAASGRRARWEESLSALLDTGAAGTGTAAGGMPIAIELSVPSAGRPEAGSSRRLVARLVRPGKTGGWASGGLTWSGLDTAH